MRVFLAVAGFLAAACTGLQIDSEGNPIAQSLNGSYKGNYLPEYEQNLFLGIPFAKPPLNELRFSNPESLNTTWIGARPATKYAFECIGYGPDQKGYLQVWAIDSS